ncbi:unnamed protein product [Adineta steineri]|uniref:Uncharacterized protein n=1 Tax=Adineta steineri TaxID=433720 RepID=A0A814ARA8_9BILA|nr:unnamed protein product [Adineta steineri]CAF0931389.1 unnamed protein product [Adineta steineri]CAF1526182.1 unnamed protein product [Adineta steineri]CAF3854587.1 unnamed protein product [Adineta steineri]CAF3882929.1 unnamed protein product [Adineta steineri]
MQSSIIALVTFGMLLACVQCTGNESISEYIIKGDFLTLGHSYTIESKLNAPTKFSTRWEPFNLGKKIFLLEDGKERFIVKHEILNLMSTWKISAAGSEKVLGTFENKLDFIGSTMEVNGEFGHFLIEGEFLNHEFTIKKDHEKVAEISKKLLKLENTYELTVFGKVDRALMVLFTIIVDEIRKH